MIRKNTGRSVSDGARFGGSKRSKQKVFDEFGHGGKARIVRQAQMITVVNLLDDDSDFESRKSEIKDHV